MDQSLPSVEKALDILEIFLNGSKAYSASDLQNLLQFPRATLYRQLRVLEGRGYLRRHPEGNKFQLGYKTLQLAAAAEEQIDLVSLAQGTLARMRDLTGETSSLGILDGIEVAVLKTVESPHLIRSAMKPGTRVPSYSTGLGKTLLAFSPDETVERVIKAGLKPIAAKTPTTGRALRKALQRVREAGFSISEREWSDVGIGIHAPIFDHRGKVVAALGVGGPIERLSKKRISEVIKIVLGGAEEVSMKLRA